MNHGLQSTPSLRDRLLNLIAQRRVRLWYLVLLVAGISHEPRFAGLPQQAANIEAILIGLSMEATIAIGMAILLISGGLDLSVGSTLALTGVVTGLVLNAGVPAVLAILVGLLAALLVGLANGLLVARLGINPFITTLGMALAVRGLVLVLAKGRAVLNLSSAFTVIGQGRLFGIQYPIYVVLTLVIIGDLLVRNSRFFRQSYYIGGNEKAARLSGISVNLVQVHQLLSGGRCWPAWPDR